MEWIKKGITMKKILFLIFLVFSFGSAIEPSIDSWWEQFNDPVMNKILSEGMRENRTLMASASRIEQSEEYRKIIRSQLLPSLYGSLRVSKRNVEEFPSFDTVFTTASATLDARYKLDSWGEELQQYRSVKLSGKATESDHLNTELRISINMASLYFDAIYAKNQLEILLNQKANSEKMMELTKSRYESGVASGYVVLQQQQQLATIEAAIPPAKMQQKNTIQFLSAITFISVEKLEKIIPHSFPDVSNASLSNLSTSFRYDIKSAKLREESAKASFTKTKLSIVPSIDLTGSIGYSFSDPILPTDVAEWNDTWTLGASITLPIYTGGAIVAGLKEARASYNTSVANTEQVEKDAERSLKNAIVQENSFTEQLKAYERMLSASKNLYEESLKQYKLGLITYSDVLVSQNSYHQSQITHLGSKKNLLNSRLTVIEAVGGK